MSLQSILHPTCKAERINSVDTIRGVALLGILLMQRHELYYIVVGIWILQLTLSPVWLRHFRFGPLEWAWRRLTYWQRQSFKRKE